ncbi:uncharacterized protein LOC144440424 [Glandiceps talaboti]
MFRKGYFRLTKLCIFSSIAIYTSYVILLAVTSSFRHSPDDARYFLDPNDWNLPTRNASVQLPKENLNHWGLTRLIRSFWYEDQRILLPVFRFTVGGPSSRHHSFKSALLYALYHKRAIVTVPFSNFYYKELSDEQFWWNFNETFDVQKLAEIITLVSTDDFYQQCLWSGITLLAEPHVIRKEGYETNYNMARQHLLQQTHIELPRLPPTPVNNDEILRRYRSVNNKPCLCMFSSNEFTKLVDVEIPETLQVKLKKLVHKHLTRAPAIKQVADKLIDYIKYYGPFITIEYSAHMKQENLISNLSRIMEKHKVECVYVAHPFFLSTAVENALRGVIPHMFTYRNAIAVGMLSNSRFAKEKYLWSLVEQEIAFRADVFIGYDHSSFSSFVIDERSAFDKTNYIL